MSLKEEQENGEEGNEDEEELWIRDVDFPHGRHIEGGRLKKKYYLWSSSDSSFFFGILGEMRNGFEEREDFGGFFGWRLWGLRNGYEERIDFWVFFLEEQNGGIGVCLFLLFWINVKDE